MHCPCSVCSLTGSLTGSKDGEVVAGCVIVEVGADPLCDRVEEWLAH